MAELLYSIVTAAEEIIITGFTIERFTSFEMFLAFCITSIVVTACMAMLFAGKCGDCKGWIFKDVGPKGDTNDDQ